MWIRRVHLQHDSNSAIVEQHEVARRIDAQQLREPAHQVLIELLAVACFITSRMRSVGSDP